MIKYRVERGVLPLPRHLSPTGDNKRIAQGETFELDEAIKDRFLRRSILNGDLAIVPPETAPAAPPAPDLQAEPDAEASPQMASIASDQPAERAQKGPRK